MVALRSPNFRSFVASISGPLLLPFGTHSVRRAPRTVSSINAHLILSRYEDVDNAKDWFAFGSATEERSAKGSRGRRWRGRSIETQLLDDKRSWCVSLNIYHQMCVNKNPSLREIDGEKCRSRMRCQKRKQPECSLFTFSRNRLAFAARKNDALCTCVRVRNLPLKCPFYFEMYLRSVLISVENLGLHGASLPAQ